MLGVMGTLPSNSDGKGYNSPYRRVRDASQRQHAAVRAARGHRRGRAARGVLRAPAAHRPPAPAARVLRGRRATAGAGCSPCSRRPTRGAPTGATPSPRRARARARRPTACSAAKLMWTHLLDLAERARPRRGRRRCALERLPGAALRPRHARRQGRPGGVAVDARCRRARGATATSRSEGAAVYHGGAIDHLVAQLTEQDEAWRAWFAANGIEPLTIAYEALADDRAGRRRRRARAPRRRARRRSRSRRLRRQGDDRSARWVERFRAERGAVRDRRASRELQRLEAEVDPRHARGRGRARAARPAVQRRQGLDRPAAPGREGVPARRAAVPDPPRRHRPQLPRGDRVPRPPGRGARRAADRRVGAGVDRRRPRHARRARRATACRPRRCSTRSRSTASTPPSAARAATRSARGPRSACSRSATSSASGTRAPSGPSSGTSTTAASARASTSACSRSPTGPSSTSGATSRPRASSCRRSTSPTQRRVFERDGMLLAESEWLEPADGEEVFETSVRYRTVGDMTVTGAVRSEAADIETVIAEIARRRGSPSAARRAPTTASPRPRWRTASARATSRCRRSTSCAWPPPARSTTASRR